MRNSLFLVSTIALVALMHIRIVDAAAVLSFWSIFCKNDAKHPAIRYACFESQEGKANYQREDLHDAVVVYNPSNSNQFLVLLEQEQASATLTTPQHTLNVYGRLEKPGNCVPFELIPRNYQAAGSSSSYCPSYSAPQII
ncbi:uncharacterized protein SRS1_15147 [Sporisorium reilianum f. sp. reilianum]|uniref:Mig1 protein n=1 Tax=Sporisorium reilianum f. sp. reilianum TaxID=72559 RepID=A0A2N8UIE4_9BASI|nr:uncharacterized protein SRS1_15147 [Sporisorium reilianum f. sp. reilianum]